MGMAAAVVGAGVLGAGATVYASGKAAKASQNATDQTIALQKAQYDDAQGRQAPFQQAGYAAVNALTGRLGLPTAGVTSAISGAPGGQAPANTNALTGAPPTAGSGAPSTLTAPLAGTTGIASPDAPGGNWSGLDSSVADTFQGTRTTPGASPQQGLALLGAGKAPGGFAGSSPATPAAGVVTPAYSDTPGAVVDPNYTGPTGFGAGTANDGLPRVASLPTGVAGGDPNAPPPASNSSGVMGGQPAAPAPNALTGAPTSAAAPGPVPSAADLTGNPQSYGNGGNPTFRDPGFTAPTAPETKPFSYTAADYTASPGYQYTVDQAMKGVLASASATGALKSGAALKALQDRASNLAYQDFSNERNAAKGIYDDNRDFGYGAYQDKRNYDTANYQTNRAFDYGNYLDSRSYLTGRADTQTGNLFNLTALGSSAVGNVNAAGANYANNSGNALIGNAGTQGSAALAGAGAINSLLGAGVNALGRGGFSGGPSLQAATNPTGIYNGGVNVGMANTTPFRF